MNSDWVTLYLFIHVFINILLYLILTICTHKHYPIGSSRPQTQVYKTLFPAFFSQFLDFSLLMNNTCSYTIKGPCVVLHLTDLSIHKQRKPQISWVSAADSYGENHFLPSSCISRVIRVTCLQTTYCPNERGHCHQRTLLCHEGGVWGLQQSLGQWYVKDPHARTQGFPAEHWPDHNTAFVILLPSLPQVNDVHAPTIHLI